MAADSEEPFSKKPRIGPGNAEECESRGAAVEDPISVIEAGAEIQVIVEGQTVKAHAAVLGLTSPVFAALITSSMQEGRTRRVELPGKTKEDFDMFLSFLRPLSRQKINVENVDRMLPLFDEYQVEVLKDEAETFLLSRAASAARLLQAHQFGLKKQYERCLQRLSEQQLIAELEELSKFPRVVQDLLPHIIQKSCAISRARPIIEQLSKSEGALKNVALILKACLKYAANLGPEEAQGILAEHTEPMSIVGALAAHCFEAQKRKIKEDVKTLGNTVHSTIDVIRIIGPQPRDVAKRMIDDFAASI